MKMAKASEADIQMALRACTMLETLERGYFPASDTDDFVDGQFDADSGDDCRIAMEQLLDELKKGSLFRVVFGMSVLLDPKNEAIDHSCDYLEHHPKVRAHDELFAALRKIGSYPKARADEMSAADMRLLARNTLSKLGLDVYARAEEG